MDHYLDSVKQLFLYYKVLGEKAIDQLEEEQLFFRFNGESNNIAILVNHIAGNMLSRFTDFLTTDGEKSWRNRDAEFLDRFDNKNDLMRHWEEGWGCLMRTLEGLSAEDLDTIVYIRNEGHTAMEAINRQLAHYAYHIGQIVFVAKMLRNDKWETLSIARNKSEDYNHRKFAQHKTKRHFTDDV